MILIELIFDAPPDEQDNVAELARQTTAATRQEHGCVLYRFTTGLDQPNRFILDRAAGERRPLEIPFRRRSIQEFLG